MVVDLVLHAFLTDLIETVKLVEIDGVPVRHDETVKDDGHPPLLPKARRANLFSLAKNYGSLGDDDVLAVVRIQGFGNEHFDRSGRVAVQAIHQDRVENRTLIDEIRLSSGLIDVCLHGALVSIGGLLRRFSSRS